MGEINSRPRVMISIARADTGGVPEHVFQLVKALDGQVEFHIACPTDRPYYQRFITLLGQDRIVEIPHRRLTVSALKAMARAVREKNIDLIHGHGKGGGVYGRLVALATGRNVIYTQHGMSPDAKFKYWFLDYNVWLDLILGKFTDASICVSEGEKIETVAQYVAKAHELNVIPNGVPNGLQRHHVNTAGQPLSLVSVSRFDAQKNPDELLEIVDLLSRRNIPGGFHMTVLGVGDGKAKFEQELANRSLEGFVTMAGAVSDVRRVFRRSDTLVSTATWEGMPLALLEAMSEGLPIVASKVVGNRDVVDDRESGFLYPLGDPESAVDAIVKLTDASIRQSFGEAGRKIIDTRHSIGHMSDQTLQLYRKVLGTQSVSKPRTEEAENEPVAPKEAA
ncbi:glycosyltransferase [Pararhizobium sp. IMCC21322]|uniref:glycosyltransferase n=1 Tax=Pararhizobium sp. IMCC21322 TaxID=3067903 RepID=UPI002741ADBA|nr:glycosyltransferase [Pararhizobium sp. IMCC21322]